MISKEKSELFHEHFSKQCPLMQNRSTMPSVFTPLTQKSLSSFQCSTKKFKSIINKLDPKKVHGHDMISIRMIKLWGDSFQKPLVMSFTSRLKQGIFPAERKKTNAVPAYKKGDHHM